MLSRSAPGFTLVEVLVALALLVVVSVGVVQLFAIAIEAGRAARDRTVAVSLATGKMEQLRSLEWRFELDAAGALARRTDTTSNLSADPIVAGGPGLSESPTGTLDASMPPYVGLSRSARSMGRNRRIDTRRCCLRPPLGGSPPAWPIGSRGRPSGARHDRSAGALASAIRSPRMERRRRPAGDHHDEEGEVRAGPAALETREAGFTLAEMLVATAIVSTAFVVLFQLAASGSGSRAHSRMPPTCAQRLRVAADMIQRDLLMAGAGLVHGADAGPLANYLPAVLPLRTGARKPDPELSFFDDRVTILYVEAGAAVAPLAANMATVTSDVPIGRPPLDVPRAGLCGFEDGTRSLIVDTSGVGLGFDLFSVSGTSAGLAHGAPDPPCPTPILSPAPAWCRSGSASTISTLPPGD